MRMKPKLTAGQVRALRIFNQPRGEMVRKLSSSSRRGGDKRQRQQAAHGIVVRLVGKGLLFRNGHGFYKTTAEGRRLLNKMAVGAS